MNSRHFIMTSMLFLLEAGKYDLAAHYLLKDVSRINDSSNVQNGKRPAKETVSRQLRQRHQAVRELYPERLTIEQMREIAREAYEQVNQALLTGKCADSLVYNGSPGI